METREVLPAEWLAFCDRFSRAHHGKAVTVETIAEDVGVQPNVQRLPLVGVTAEGEAGEQRLEIIVGDSPHAHLTHVIDQPMHVRVAEWNDGFSAALQIESADGRVTLLRVGPQERVLPQGMIVDGVVLPGSEAI